jgi:hypothetical protein
MVCASNQSCRRSCWMSRSLSCPSPFVEGATRSKTDAGARRRRAAAPRRGRPAGATGAAAAGADAGVLRRRVVGPRPRPRRCARAAAAAGLRASAGPDGARGERLVGSDL